MDRGDARRALLLALIFAALAPGLLAAGPAEEEDTAPPPPAEEEKPHSPLPGSHAHLPPSLSATMGEPILYRELAQAAGQDWVRNICVTGLDGHAAAVLLLSSPKAVVYRCAAKGETQPGAVEALLDEFGPRYVHLEGDTQRTLPELAKRQPRVRCDLLFAGSRPNASVATVDLANLRRLANPRYNEVFAVNASGCGSDRRCVANGAAWQAAVEAGILIPSKKTPITENGRRRLLAGEFEPEAAEPARMALAHFMGAHASRKKTHTKQKLRGQAPRHHVPRRSSSHAQAREPTLPSPWVHLLGLKHKVVARARHHPLLQKHAKKVKKASHPRRRSGWSAPAQSE